MTMFNKKTNHFSKLVLINNKGTDYLELELYGNLHFIGDQGAGKTMVLRTILFFYAPDISRRLGIKPTEENFADFYLPYADSHIVYEVVNDQTTFLVWVYAIGNRPVFQFINSPYKQNFFIKEDGRVKTPDEVRKTLRANGISFTRQVKTYNEYKKILYGVARGNELKEFRDFYLLRSNDYKSLPRIITNIFLNSRLDSSDIKEVLIKSLFDYDFENVENSEYKIDIRRIKGRLDSFRASYNDIVYFKRKMKTIDRIVNIYNTIIELEENLKQQAEYIGKTYNLYKNRLPELEANRQHEQLRLGDLKMQLKLIKKEHAKVLRELQDKRVLIHDKLQTALEKQRYWSKDVKIDEVLARINQENLIINELEATENEYQTLTNKYQSIEQKYKNLVDNLKNQRDKNINELERQKTVKKAEVDNEKSNLLSKYNDKADRIRYNYEQQEDKFQQEIEQIQEKLTEIKGKIFIVKKTVYFEEEISSFEKKIAGKQHNITQLQSEIQLLKNDIEKIEYEKKFQLEKLDNEYDAKKQVLKSEIQDLEQQIKEIQDKLSDYESTLYYALDEQHPRWRENIAKVVDEEILFIKGLDFEIENPDNDLLYGVRLDLENLPTKILSKDGYKKNLERLEEELENVKKDAEKAWLNYNNQRSEIEGKYDKKLRKLANQISEKQKFINHLKERELPKLNRELNELKNKSELKKKEELNKLYSELGSYENELKEKKQRKIALREDRQNALAQLDKELKDKIKELELKFHKELSGLDKKIQQVKQSFEQKKAELLQQKQVELASKGIPKQKLIELENRISHLDKELEEIRKLKEEYLSRYKEDKENFLDKIDEFRESLQRIDTKINEKTQLFEKIEQEKQNEIDRKQQELKFLDDSIKRYKAGIAKFREYKQDYLKYFSRYADYFENELEADREFELVKLLEQFNQMNFKYDSDFETLRRLLKTFAGGLSEKNIFKWQPNLGAESREEYLNFAKELRVYIEQNKIEVVEKSIVKEYVHIINFLTGGFYNLIRKRSDVEKLIREINREFENQNFVKAIDNFRIEFKDTDNKIVNALKAIDDFNRKSSIGLDNEPNLFTYQENFENTKLEAFKLLLSLMDAIDTTKNIEFLELKDTFKLKFIVIQNGIKREGESLNDVGSRGTDILLKVMINIIILDIFKRRATKKMQNTIFYLHSIMDEIGQIHSDNVRALINFANGRNIWMIFGSPNPDLPTLYRAVYQLYKDKDKNTKAEKIIIKNEE